MMQNKKAAAVVIAIVLAVCSGALVASGSSGDVLYGLASIYLVLFLILAPLALLVGLWLRWRRSEYKGRFYEALEGEDEDPDETTEPNFGALGLALLAAALAVVAVFLSRAESTTFSRIAENSLIQSGSGWLILGCAVGIIGATYRAYSQGTPSWSIFFLGLVILAIVVYEGTGSRMDLESAGRFLGPTIKDHGSPAVGIYAAGAAGVLAMMAGWILSGHPVSSFETSQRRTKTCPECAERVMGEARLCKHCGYRFAPQATSDISPE